MEIKLLKNSDERSVLVFVLKISADSRGLDADKRGQLKEEERLETHAFYRFLNKEDQKFISAFNKKSAIGDGHSHLVYLPSGREVFLLGVAEKKRWNHRKALMLSRRVVSVARKERVKSIAVNLEDFISSDFTPLEARRKASAGARGALLLTGLAEILATSFEMANFEFTHYKETPKGGWNFVEEVRVFSKKSPKSVVQSLTAGKIIGEEINKARVLSNTPGGDMTPQKLAEEAVKSGQEAGFKVRVLAEKEIRELKMGGVLGVSKGSEERPKFIIAEYLRGKKNDAPIVLVGKGVTFDSGGLNLKPEQGIYEMHMDMSGGAAVIHIIAALARLKVKRNVVGLVPAVENMPSGSSYRPGDLLKSMSGKTIEVLNTDAEGRIILADALTYAKKYNPSFVIDIATLTGAAMVALGQRASAIFTSDEKLEKKLRVVGERVGDFVWPLPLWEEYEEEVKGTFGDLANATANRYGRAINGAIFLWQFIKGTPWVHIDIAPRMTAIESEFLAKGAAGAAIALLTHFIRGNTP